MLVVKRTVRPSYASSTWSPLANGAHHVRSASSRREARRPPSRTYASVTIAGGSNVEVRICTNSSCRKLGSKQVLQYFRELVDSSQVTVSPCGCLGQCGNGPNLVLLPSELVLRHVQTPAQVSSLIKRQLAGGESAEKAFEVLQLRTEGNQAFESGNLGQAIEMYGKALELGYPEGRHLLHGNRSAAHFSSGNIDGALADAQRATQLAPEWAKGYIRLADALEAKGEYEDAMEALHAALDRDDSLVTSASFRRKLKKVHDEVAKTD